MTINTNQRDLNRTSHGMFDGAVPIVGIGTSAGGLEALELFLSHVPKNSGLAYVIIQHLSPDHQGNLAGLLQHFTSMVVEEATNGVKVKPDCVYVIPSNKDMTVMNHTLVLRDPVAKHGLRLPIDTFFCSLADDCADRSVGVILSGMGSDGTLGMQAIREQAGLTLVQAPSTAKYDSMPSSVITAGIADIVAPAEALPEEIIRYLSCVAPAAGAEHHDGRPRLSSFQKITSLLKARTKHDFSLYKPSSVYRRIERRMRIHKIDAIAEYAKFLLKNSQEVDLLFKELLIGVTSFFRDPAMWDDLKAEALPKILSGYPEGGGLRAWACGCSSGEEAYSLAILFRELLDQVRNPERFTLQIFATDLDADAIDKARKGLYGPQIAKDVTPERLQRFFIESEGGYLVSKQIREMVLFAQHDVIKDPPYTKLDLLICRNVLIYFSAELQHLLMPLFHYSLKPGGLLFLGSAESIGKASGLFSDGRGKSKMFWRSDVAQPVKAIAIPKLFPPYRPTFPVQESRMPAFTDELQTQADRLVLQHFSAPTVLVNDQGDIVYISGRTGRYLEPAAGRVNNNIFAMAREGILYELGGAFKQVLQQKEPLTVKATLDEGKEGKLSVEITLLKVEDPEALKGMVMISFKDVASPPRRPRRVGSPPDGGQYEELEKELDKVKRELHICNEEKLTTLEELKSINEELQSTNEELQSTNEELTTSKEEMQSMNEELQTVNAEQSSRLEESMCLNNDMENLLNSTEIVTIFLDDRLQVRRFTSGATRLFKLIPGDVGRPLTDIVSNMDYPQLYAQVQDVLARLVSQEAEVVTGDGSWIKVRIMPYRTMDKRIDGVVITCADITEAKRLEGELRDKIARLEQTAT